MKLRREAFWAVILVIIAIDLWWSSTPVMFELWWIPLILLNVAGLAVVLYPMIVRKD